MEEKKRRGALSFEKICDRADKLWGAYGEFDDKKTEEEYWELCDIQRNTVAGRHGWYTFDGKLIYLKDSFTLDNNNNPVVGIYYIPIKTLKEELMDGAYEYEQADFQFRDLFKRLKKVRVELKEVK